MSKKGVSFKERGIRSSLLNTVRAQMKQILPNKGCYIKLNTNCDIAQAVYATRMLGTKDENFNLIVFRERSDMSDPEAIYYYIRNAFAHGLFEVRSTQHGNVYLLESAKKRNVNARMRLNETAMMELARIMDLTSGDLMALQRRLERVGGGRIHPATSS